MTSNYIYIAFIILINLLIFINFKTIKNKIKLIDDPKKEIRKIHKKPISQIGGIWLLFNLFIMFLFSKNFVEIRIFNEPIDDLKIFHSFWIGLLFLFLIGLVDDKLKIKTSIKSMLLLLSIIFVLLIDKNLILNTINLSFLEKSFTTGTLSFFFTLLAILLFINATNLYDGVFLFLIGLVDDKLKIKTSIKSMLLLLSIIFVLLIDKNLILNTINLSFLEKSFTTGTLSFFFTLLAILLFINATNLYDGVDLQLGFYSLFLISFFLFLKLSFYFFLTLFIFIIFYLILNYKKLIFFGDNGSYVIGFLFSYLFIKSYNYEVIDYADQIFLIMILPGVDMFRLFIIRIFSKKNPFYPDQNHIHHMLLNRDKNNIIQVNLITLFLAVSPLVISLLFNSNILGLTFFLIIYSLIIYLKKN